jgi:hypothetical protein
LLKDGCEGRDGVIDMIQTDKNSNAFGLTKESLDTKPMAIKAHLLPQAKIQYANKVLDPELKGKALSNTIHLSPS